MRSPALDAFIAAIRSDETLQRQVRSLTSLNELVAVAHERGHELNPRQLQLWAHSPCFDDPWWPWAGEVVANRRIDFFRGV